MPGGWCWKPPAASRSTLPQRSPRPVSTISPPARSPTPRRASTWGSISRCRPHVDCRVSIIVRIIIRLKRSQLILGRRGRGRIAPAWLIGAVAPVARAVEGVHADLVELGHLADPARAHPVGVVVRGLADVVEP